MQFANMADVLEQTVSKRQALLDLPVGQSPDAWDRRAAAGVLHDWYGGVENCLKRICKLVDREIPAGEDSHKQLLAQVARPEGERPAVVSPDLHNRLQDYLAFRHVARHKYSIELDWARQRPLLESLPMNHARFVDEVRRFLNALPSK